MKKGGEDKIPSKKYIYIALPNPNSNANNAAEPVNFNHIGDIPFLESNIAGA